MKKALPVVAALLAWIAALTMLSGFDATDAERDETITARTNQ